MSCLFVIMRIRSYYYWPYLEVSLQPQLSIVVSARGPQVVPIFLCHPPNSSATSSSWKRRAEHIDLDGEHWLDRPGRLRYYRQWN